MSVHSQRDLRCQTTALTYVLRLLPGALPLGAHLQVFLSSPSGADTTG